MRESRPIALALARGSTHEKTTIAYKITESTDVQEERDRNLGDSRMILPNRPSCTMLVVVEEKVEAEDGCR